MNDPDLDSMSAEELRSYYLGKYESGNPISRFLVRRFFQRTGELLKCLGPADRVLEVGCGAGASSLRIKAMLPTSLFEVSEYEERQIAAMKTHDFPIPVTQESVYEMHREDGSFDCVIMLEVLEHLDDVERALTELFRVSRKYVILSVPNEPLWRLLNMSRGMYLRHWGNTPGHIKHWTPWGFRRLVARYGIVERVLLPVPWTLLLARKREAGFGG